VLTSVFFRRILPAESTSQRRPLIFIDQAGLLKIISISSGRNGTKFRLPIGKLFFLFAKEGILLHKSL